MTKDTIILERGMNGWLVTSRGVLVDASVVHISEHKAWVCGPSGSLGVVVSRYAATVTGYTAYAESVEGHSYPKCWFYLSPDGAKLHARELYLERKRYDVEMWARRCSLETIARLLEIMKEEENGAHLLRAEEH